MAQRKYTATGGSRFKLAPLFSHPSPTKRCTSDEFQCTKVNQCIPFSKKCDLSKDCTDGSDEDHCVSSVCWIICVVFGIILISFMFIICYKNNTTVKRARHPHAMDNSLCGLNLDTLNFGQLNSHMPVRHGDGVGVTAIENPLYGFKSEIK